MKGFDEQWLRDRGLKQQDDGTYKKQKQTSLFEEGAGAEDGEVKEKSLDSESRMGLLPGLDIREGERMVGQFNEGAKKSNTRSIEIRLFGDPMPKQSVKIRAFKDKQGNARATTYQPKKYKDRENDYIKQIKAQLPKDFDMFTQEVVVEQMTFIFPPLKSFSKKKMKFIEEGGIVPKTTKPDLPDNLKKLPLDAMSGLVFKDDSLIWKECLTEKIYGLGGCIIIRLRGK